MSEAELLTSAQISTTIAEYSVTAAALAVLRQRMEGVVYDVSTTKGLDVAKKDRAEIRAYRIALENKRVEIKAPALQRAREIDSEATRIRLELEKLEAIPDAVIKAEEARKEKEREAKIAAEVARVAAIHERIAELRGNQLLTPADGSKLIGEHIADLEKIAVDESFDEFQALAASAKAGAIERLSKLLTAAQAHEAEQERLRIEREQLAAQRAAQEEANRKERERIAAEEAAAKLKRDAEEAEARRKRKAEELAAAAERKRVQDEHEAKLRAEREESERLAKQQREQREREDADRRERQRIEDEQRQAEQRRQQEELQRQQAAIEAQRAELERLQQFSLAVVPTAVQSTEIIVGHSGRLEPIIGGQCALLASNAPAPTVITDNLPESWSPSATDIANLVATEYGVSFDEALVWCMNAFDGEEAA